MLPKTHQGTFAISKDTEAFLGYECSHLAGNAACSWHGIVYPDDGSPYSVAYGSAHCNTTNTTTPSSAPINSLNVSGTLTYATSTASPRVLLSTAFHVGNAIADSVATPTTKTITSYSTAEVSVAPSTSVATELYEVSGVGHDVASAAATPTSSTSPIQDFPG